MKYITIVLLAVIFGIGIGYYGIRYMQWPMGSCNMALNERQCSLRGGMDKLWEDHIVWTRNYIISEVADLSDLNDVTQRLLRNQVDIGNAIKPFYGDEAGEKLSSLLKEHIILASKVVKAAKEDNKKELDLVTAQWYKNADEISSFLAGANSNWSKDALKDMLYKHLEYTTGEAVSRLQHKWKEDIDFYDINHDHMLMFSEMLIDGIKKQFPNKI